MNCALCGSALPFPAADGVCTRCALQNAAAPGGPAAADPGLEGYELIRELGRGATSTVWLARERRLDRLVALKRISLGGDPLATARLGREGKLAASLDHPHIVAVHALGGEGNTAFLVMDFLEGGNLDERLAGRPLPPREAAGLVAKLAAAVAHAHAAGILHRDLKPSNVLLTAAGEPKLADFGLAGALQGRGDLTRPDQVAGTPAYLAPELLTSAEPPTAAADIYGLGALLYFILTGRAPFADATTAGILQQVATAEPVPPRLLQPNVPRDLETICLKCLGKAPGGRYASATALREDLERFARGEPITARPLGRWARSLRWCRRHRATATAAGLAMFILLLLAIGGPLVALRLERSRRTATEAAATATAISDFLQKDLLLQASPDNQPDRDLKLRTVLDRAAQAIGNRFAGHPEIEINLRLTLGDTYFALGDYAAAQTHFSRALALALSAGGPDDPVALGCQAKLAAALLGLGRFDAAARLAGATWQKQKQRQGEMAPASLFTQNLLANALRLQGHYPEAESLLGRLLASRRAVSGPEHRDTLAVMNSLAAVLAEAGKLAESEALYNRSLDLHRRIFGPEHPETMQVMADLAVVYNRENKLAEAEAIGNAVLALQERVLGPEHPSTLMTLNNLASIDRDLGKFGLSADHLRRALSVRERRFGENNPDTLTMRNNLAVILRDEGRLAEAEGVARQVLAAREKLSGPQHPYTLSAVLALASICKQEGKFAEAESLWHRAYESRKQVLGPAHPDTLWAATEYGDVLRLEGNHARATEVFQAALDVAAHNSWDEWKTALTRSRLGAALTELQRFPEAEPLLLSGYEQLVRLHDRLPAHLRGETPEARKRIEHLYLVWGRPDAAVRWSQPR